MRYTPVQRAEALNLADEIGAKKASAQLKIAYPTILDWRKKRSVDFLEADVPPLSPPSTVDPSSPIDSTEKTSSLLLQMKLLQQENAHLRILLARQAKAIHALAPIDED